MMVSAFALTARDAYSLPILSEVLYDGQGSDAREVFTELSGPPGMLLDGWSLVGVNGSSGVVYRTVDLSDAIIPGDGILVIATASAVGALLLHRDFVAPVDWQNGPDAVQLRNTGNDIIDALQYGDAAEHNAGEGTPAPDVSAGFSLSRDEFGTDTDNNINDFKAGMPTPGERAAAVPEPSPRWMLVMGLAVLARFLQRSLKSFKYSI
jgi:hypothetical protein